jgi:hypothetical protein
VASQLIGSTIALSKSNVFIMEWILVWPHFFFFFLHRLS